MKTLFTTLAVLAICTPCFANITVDDLPYLEGTPLLERVNESPVWSVLDYAEENGTVQWAWLDNLGQIAYLAYPNSSETVVFPDGFELPANSQQISISIKTQDEKDWRFSRFGGEVVIRGAEIAVSYSPELSDALSQGNTYHLQDTHTLNLSGNSTARFVASEQILAIKGTASDDTLQAPNTENIWTLVGDSEGTLETGGENRATVKFSSIERLSGGDMNDTFEISTDGVSLPSIDGNGGAVLIIANILVTSDGSNLGSGLSGNLGAGSIICSGSGLTISSDPNFNEPGSGCPTVGNVSSTITLPDMIHGELTPCRFPEPHEYDGEKKILCGENWVEVPDDIWAEYIATSGQSLTAEQSPEQSAPQKKKSKGGEFSTLTLQLLGLLFILKNFTRKRKHGI